MSTRVVTDEGELRDLVDEVVDRGEFAFDCETIGVHELDGVTDVRLDPRRAQVVWLAVATSGLSFTVPMGHPVGRQVGTKKIPRQDVDRVRMVTVPDWSPPPKQLRPAKAFAALEPLFFEPDILKIGHNIKYDIECVQKYYDGDIPVPEFFDTQVAAHMLNENQHEYKLGKVVEREFGFKYDKTIGAQIERYSFLKAAQYNHFDAKYTWLLYKKFAPMLAKQHLDGLWALEMDLLDVLLRMEDTGALLDVAAAEKLYAELTRRRDQIIGELFRLAGGKEINFNSNQQMQALLYGKRREGGFGLKPKMMTKGGAPSTAKDALELYQDHPFVEKYLELQTVDRIHGTYLKAYLGGETLKAKGKRQVVETKPTILLNGKVHANFKQHGTVTGRFSCGEPNLQNIPRPDTDLGKQVRGLFIAPPGHSLVVADYAQIEYVVMAHFSRDKFLVEAFSKGVDVHQYVAAMVFGIDIEDVTKTQRTTAKNTNFAVAYGAGIDKIAAMSKISMSQAESFSAAHKKLLPKLYRWTDTVIADCRRARPPHITTLLGRRRRLPAIHSQNWGARSYAERQAVNTKVQGSAADIIKLSMVRLDSKCDEEMRLSLTIHDELALICPNDRLDEGQKAMEWAMLGEGIQSLLSVDMKIDMKVVQRWSEAK